MYKIGPYLVVHRRELPDGQNSAVDQIRGAMLAGMTSAVTPLRDDIAKLRMELGAVRSGLPSPGYFGLAQADAINQDLLAACMRADHLFHALRDRGLLGPDDQAVCDQLVAAIGAAIGAAPTPEAP